MTTQRLLTIGECMVEMAPAGDGTYAMGFAGDTFNTAWYARRIAGPDLEVAYLSAVGDDAISARMAAFMADAGVVPELQVVPGRSVGLYLIDLKDGERSFSYWRSVSAARCLADDLSALAALSPGDMALFSGITVAILSGDARARLRAALSEARGRGVRIVFDPNLRPRLWRDADEMRHEIMAAAAVSDIALPSFEDEAVHFGDADPEATGRRYLSAGAGLAVVKNGPDPVLMLRADGTEVSVAPRPVAQVVDTTAAGDAFNAGFLVALARGADLETAAAEACALSARVIAARGALVPVGPGGTAA